jgi:hypothetical protein
MVDYILIDDFFINVNTIREYALSLDYTKSSKKTGWKGNRVKVSDTDIINYIKSKLVEKDTNFINLDLEVYFHYSTKSTKNEIYNFEKNRLHRDVTEWAGVVYLHPSPKENSGTTLQDNTSTYNIENKYNRFIFYKGNVLHGVLDTFGDDIHTGRLTITMFGSNSKKNKTLI